MMNMINVKMSFDKEDDEGWEISSSLTDRIGLVVGEFRRWRRTESVVDTGGVRL